MKQSTTRTPHHIVLSRLPSSPLNNNLYHHRRRRRPPPPPFSSSSDVSPPPQESQSPPPPLNPEVAEALAKVAEAIAVAEETAQRIEQLPSARLPTQWGLFFSSTLKPLLQSSLLIGYCVLIHSFHATSQAIGGLFLALAVAAWGYRKGSLSPSGAVAAAGIGWATLAPSFRSGLVLLAFFFVSSQFTKLGEEEKAGIEEGHKHGGQRDWKQVACNALVPAVLAIAAASMTGGVDLALRSATHSQVTALYAAFLGYFSCCCGDTWASELGQLSPEEPRLITSLRPVRKGTNGGVTLVGLAASVAGGVFMGAVFYVASVLSPTMPLSPSVAARTQWKLLVLGVVGGLLGSIIDSILGATVQFTGYNRKTGKVTGRVGEDVVPISGFPLLDNNMVNAVSASATALLIGLGGVMLF